MDEVDLAVASHLIFDGSLDQLFAERCYGGLNRQAVARRRFDQRHVAQADEGHVQGARDGRGGKCQRVDVFAHLFQAFLVGDAETLLFVNNEQAEVLEFYVLGKQAMRADDDVHFSGFKVGENDFLLGGGAETAEHFDARGKCGEAFLEGFKMLESEDGCRREHGDLLAVGNRLECGAHRHFRFAVANVAAEQAVHRCCFFQIFLDVGDGGALVCGLFKLKGIFEFTLPGAIGSEGEALGGFALGVKSQQLVGHIFQRFPNAGFSRCPGRAAQPVECGFGAFHDAIALHQVHAFERNVEARVVRVTQQHELAAAAFGFDQSQTFELPDAVIHVNDVIAGLQLGEIGEEAAGADFAAGAFDGRGYIEQIGIAVDRDLCFGKRNALGKRRADKHESRAFRSVFGSEARGGFFGFAEHVGNFVFAADVGVALEFAEAGGCQIDSAAGSELRFHLADTGSHVAVEAGAWPRTKLEALAAVLR